MQAGLPPVPPQRPVPAVPSRSPAAPVPGLSAASSSELAGLSLFPSSARSTTPRAVAGAPSLPGARPPAPMPTVGTPASRWVHGCGCPVIQSVEPDRMPAAPPFIPHPPPRSPLPVSNALPTPTVLLSRVDPQLSARGCTVHRRARSVRHGPSTPSRVPPWRRAPAAHCPNWTSGAPRQDP